MSCLFTILLLGKSIIQNDLFYFFKKSYLKQFLICRVCLLISTFRICATTISKKKTNMCNKQMIFFFEIIVII